MWFTGSIALTPSHKPPQHPACARGHEPAYDRKQQDHGVRIQTLHHRTDMPCMRSLRSLALVALSNATSAVIFSAFHRS